MKSVLFVLISSSCFGLTAQASGNTYSAFTYKYQLITTILADTCNSYFAKLKVDPFCQEDRTTRNAAPTCKAELVVASTKKGCANNDLLPKVLTVDLAKSNVAHEAELLVLTYEGQTIKVGINK